MVTVWIKRGVYGDLQTPMQKGLGKIIGLYDGKGIEDFYITSIREGNHGYRSLHYIGLAVDFLKQGISINAIKEILGSNYDVLEYDVYFHVEYDPKEE